MTKGAIDPLLEHAEERESSGGITFETALESIKASNSLFFYKV